MEPRGQPLAGAPVAALQGLDFVALVAGAEQHELLIDDGQELPFPQRAQLGSQVPPALAADSPDPGVFALQHADDHALPGHGALGADPLGSGRLHHRDADGDTSTGERPDLRPPLVVHVVGEPPGGRESATRRLGGPVLCHSRPQGNPQPCGFRASPLGERASAPSHPKVVWGLRSEEWDCLPTTRGEASAYQSTSWNLRVLWLLGLHRERPRPMARLAPNRLAQVPPDVWPSNCLTPQASQQGLFGHPLGLPSEAAERCISPGHPNWQVGSHRQPLPFRSIRAVLPSIHRPRNGKPPSEPAPTSS